MYILLPWLKPFFFIEHINTFFGVTNKFLFDIDNLMVADYY